MIASALLSICPNWQSHVSNDWRSHVSNDCSLLLEVNLVRPRVWLLVSTHLPPKHLRRERCERKDECWERDDCSTYPCSHLSCSHVELKTSHQFVLLVRESRSSRRYARLARLGPKTPRLHLEK